ncbi:MAG: hypothetical protein Tsb0017_00760 [Geothermobacteraceae bacterium]
MPPVTATEVVKNPLVDGTLETGGGRLAVNAGRLVERQQPAIPEKNATGLRLPRLKRTTVNKNFNPVTLLHTGRALPPPSTVKVYPPDSDNLFPALPAYIRTGPCQKTIKPFPGNFR